MNRSDPPSTGKPSFGSHPHEEPEIRQEEDVPLDGKDVEGERLMKEVRNPKLEVEPGAESDSDGAS
ncbi:MAG: hypothetical protein EOO24_10230 [Comamonadaceae bacterium]|nr:MAG: hypothetical protein EOO24_10230 [Comamonadaceae bacterium]